MGRGYAIVALAGVLTAAMPVAAPAQSRSAKPDARADVGPRAALWGEPHLPAWDGYDFRQVGRWFAQLLRERGHRDRPGGALGGTVTADDGAPHHGLGFADSIAAPRHDRTRVSIRDLLANDLGLRCDFPCDFADSTSLELTGVTAGDNVRSIERRGQFLFVEARKPGTKATFRYDLTDRATGRSSSVAVDVWFGNRAPQARRDHLLEQANQVTSYDVSALLGNDRDRDGDPLELVRVWCPAGGRVFTQEVDGQLRVFFQPDENFTGVAYFRYTVADLDEPRAYRVASRGGGAGGLRRPERKTFAQGIVRVRVVASPS